MPGVRDIKRRIRSITSIQQITKAMKMVSAAKLRRTQEAVISSRPYTGKMEEVLGRIVASTPEKIHPFTVARPVKSVGYVLITADKGLAAGYNSNLIRRAVLEAARASDAQTGFVTVGRKGRDYMRRRNKKIDGQFMGIKDIPTAGEAVQIAGLAVKLYLEGTYDEVYLIYQEFINTIQQRPVVKKLLPIPYEEKESGEESDYLYEPQPKQVLDMLLPKYINNKVFQALIEAKASEHGARMTAMDSATGNASEMIDELTLSFNRARQAAITREITEIVGGANALKAQ